MQVNRDSDLYRVIGNGFSAHQLNKAIIAYSRAIKINPNLDEVYSSWGNVLRFQKKYKEALIKTSKAAQINPYNTRAYRIIGLIYEAENKYDQAEAEYRKAIKINPRDSMAYLCLGSLLDDQKRYQEAEATLFRAAQISPNNFDVHYTWALTVYNQLRYQEAASIFREAHLRDPSNVDTIVSYGLILGYLGQLAEEIQTYVIAIDLIRNDLEKVEKVIGVYEAEVVKSEKSLSELSDTAENEPRREHYKREVEGMKRFLAMLYEVKKTAQVDGV